MKTDIKFFEEYFQSSYKEGNILSIEQYQKASNNFDRLYKDILPQNKDAKILDIGCGAGHFLFFLIKNNYKNTFGIDISRQQIEECQKRGLQNVYLSDALDYLKEKNNFYDIITAHDVLEHITKEKLQLMLEAIYKSLKTGGIFFVRVPNLSNPFSIDSRYSDITHEGGFTSKSLYQILYVYGFRDIKILPPVKIVVRSYRNLIRKIMISGLHGLIRLAFYIQDFSVPKNLDKNLVAVSFKNEKNIGRASG